MKLLCDILLSTRLGHLNHPPRPRKRGCISLCANKGECVLVVSTTTDNSGTIYKLKTNVEKLFSNFINEGKATIRLKQPSIDISICKADRVQLKAFLVQLNHVLKGKQVDVVLPNTSSAKFKATNLRTLKIQSRKDYPITKGFSSTLTCLEIMGCQLKKIDSRIFNLRLLQTLNVSNNSLTTLPEDLGRLHLHTLIVENNQIITLPDNLFRDCWRVSLHTMNLRCNSLVYLPETLTELANLSVLDVISNKLKWLPSNIGALRNLMNLNCAHNNLTVLPAQMMSMSLRHLDLSDNPFTQDTDRPPTDMCQVPSLQECAAVTIVLNRDVCKLSMLPRMMTDYLNSAVSCFCGRPSFESGVDFVFSQNMNRMASDFVRLQGNSSRVPIAGRLCSNKCVGHIYSNPAARIIR